VKSALILCYGHVAVRAPRELVLAKVESDILRNMSQCFSTKVSTLAICGGWSHDTGVSCFNYFTLCCSGSGNKGRDQGTVCRNRVETVVFSLSSVLGFGAEPDPELTGFPGLGLGGMLYIWLQGLLPASLWSSFSSWGWPATCG
jgi:hypothetical protein